MNGSGSVRSFNGLTFLTVFDAGHMVPSDQPEAALTMFNTFITGGDLYLGKPDPIKSAPGRSRTAEDGKGSTLLNGDLPEGTNDEWTLVVLARSRPDSLRHLLHSIKEAVSNSKSDFGKSPVNIIIHVDAVDSVASSTSKPFVFPLPYTLSSQYSSRSDVLEISHSFASDWSSSPFLGQSTVLTPTIPRGLRGSWFSSFHPSHKKDYAVFLEDDC